MHNYSGPSPSTSTQVWEALISISGELLQVYFGIWCGKVSQKKSTHLGSDYLLCVGNYPPEVTQLKAGNMMMEISVDLQLRSQMESL